MPKLSIDFPAQLSVQVTDLMKWQLVTIGYQTGHGKEYAGPVRNGLERAIRDYLDKLSPRERKEYDEILENVKIMFPSKTENQKAPII
jgi:hypothetical protein